MNLVYTGRQLLLRCQSLSLLTSIQNRKICHYHFISSRGTWKQYEKVAKATPTNTHK